MLGDWQCALKRLFRLAVVLDGYAYRSWNTFAVELCSLQVFPSNGFPSYLGHQSIKMMDKHYAPWVKAQQEQLEADVRRI